MDIYTLLDKYRDGAVNNREQGDKFERLIKSYLLTDSLYTADNAFKDVWLWGEFPYREQLGGQDTGIDIVARTAAGAWWATKVITALALYPLASVF